MQQKLFGKKIDIFQREELFHKMNAAQLSDEQRFLAVQRLTALWAFSESGMGGVLHALQVPFTGLIVGGAAIILITFISYFSSKPFSQLLHSLIIVLAVKATVSPHTPFPAYIAVSFQAFLGFVLFNLLHVNLLSILLLSVLAMIESAIQKILVLTFFFGKSIWKAADELVNFVTMQFSFFTSKGSLWIMSLYLFIYCMGGVFIALMTNRLIKRFSKEANTSFSIYPLNTNEPMQIIKKGRDKKLLNIVLVLISISIILFLFKANTQAGLISVLRAFCWTLSAILIWYTIITPLLTKIIVWVLKKKQDQYSKQINATLSFLPILNQLTFQAWKASAVNKGWRRISIFLFTLINWSLVYSDSSAEPDFINKKP